MRADSSRFERIRAMRADSQSTYERMRADSQLAIRANASRFQRIERIRVRMRRQIPANTRRGSSECERSERFGDERSEQCPVNRESAEIPRNAHAAGHHRGESAIQTESQGSVAPSYRAPPPCPQSRRSSCASFRSGSERPRRTVLPTRSS